MSDSAAPHIPKPQDTSTNYREVGIIVGEADLESSSSELDKTHKRQIYIAAASGNWSEASSYFKIHPHWWRVPLDDRGNTALHVAVRMRKTNFAEMLVDSMNVQDLENCKAEGNTAFCLAAITGNLKIAEIMLRKNSGLPWIRGQKDMLPIQLASSAGHIPMTEFLFQALQEDLHNSIPFQDLVKLFFFAINNNIYSVASKLLERYPKLVVAKENNVGLTPLQMLAQLSLFKETIGHQDIVSSLFKGMEQEKESLNNVQLSKAMFDAAKSGNIVILEFLFKYHPYLLFEVDSREQRNLLHIAILYRQETVYRLILNQGDSKNVMIQLVDFEGNNVLHLAGKLAQPEARFGLPRKYVLMRNEEIWFKEVEKIVPPAMQTMRNKDGLTPKELFYWSHKELHKESTAETTALANTLIVVATLIITLGISIFVTIPIKDIDSTTTPIFRKKTWYTIFFLSVGFETCFCASSILFYASAIFPPDIEPKDQSVHVQEKKIIFGSLSLFLSGGTMLTTIISGATLIFDFLSNWGPYFTLGLGLLVFVVHFTLDYTLWSRIVTHFVLSFSKVALEKLTRLLWTIPKSMDPISLCQTRKA